MMQPALDLAPIQARWAAATPGTWVWFDDLGPVPYQEAWQDDDGMVAIHDEPSDETDSPIGGNDGTLGVKGLFNDQAFFEDEDDEEVADLEPIFSVAPKVADAWCRLARSDDRDWRGPIEVSNPADLVFLMQPSRISLPYLLRPSGCAP